MVTDPFKGNGRSAKHVEFPFAPEEWAVSDAERIAKEEGLALGQDHIALLGALQEYYHKHDKADFSIRELHDALEERFHFKGGMKYLYKLCPGGPVAQGCRLAGLNAPAGAEDISFGSVQ